MNTKAQNPSFDAIVSMATTLCNQPNLPTASLLTLSTVLLNEVHASWDAIPDSTRAIIIGVTAQLMREAVQSGEYQSAMDSLLQPDATRQ